MYLTAPIRWTLRRLIPATLVAAAVWCAPAPLWAQACTAQPHQNINIELSTSMVAFPPPGAENFDQGAILASNDITVDVQVRGNRGWELCIRSDDPDLGASGSKPLEHLQWSMDGSDEWLPVTSDNFELISDRGSQTVTIQFRMVLDWETDEPGSYGALMVFTIVRG